MKIDWDRRTCARRGHVTYAPDEAVLRDRLRAETGLGEAWRCLRCGDFALGDPHGSGPAVEAPLVPRGTVLRDLFVLRFLAVERAVRGVLSCWSPSRSGGSATARTRSGASSTSTSTSSVRCSGTSTTTSTTRPSSARSRRRSATGTPRCCSWPRCCWSYALVEIVEAVGLWYARRWAEYLTVVATAAFLPPEVYELTEHLELGLKVATLLLNILSIDEVVAACGGCRSSGRGRGGQEAPGPRLRSWLGVRVAAASGGAESKRNLNEGGRGWVRLTPLPWSRLYFVSATTAWPAGPSEVVRRELAQQVLPSTARAAEADVLDPVDDSMPAAIGAVPPRSTFPPSRTLLAPADDADAVALAERIASRWARDFGPVAVTTRSASEVARAMAGGREPGVLGVPRELATTTHQRRRRDALAPSGAAPAEPLVCTRATLVSRAGITGVTWGYDGVPRLDRVLRSRGATP